MDCLSGVAADSAAFSSFNLSTLVVSTICARATRASTVASTFGAMSAEGILALEPVGIRVLKGIIRTTVHLIHLF